MGLILVLLRRKRIAEDRNFFGFRKSPTGKTTRFMDKIQYSGDQGPVWGSPAKGPDLGLGGASGIGA